MSEEIIGAIGKIGDEPSKLVKTVPNQDHFEGLMKQAAQPKDPLVVDQTSSKPSPIEEFQNSSQILDRTQGVTPKDVIEQAHKTIETIDSLKQNLQRPDLQIKSSTESLLNNKLIHIDENLQIALSKVGSEIRPQEPVGMSQPIERFLGFLSHSQHQLDTLAMDVQRLQEHGSTFSPAMMLAVQTKVGYVQQELEFFTSLLNKALESTKTIMNVQV
jgi:hypothetical protein